MFDCSRKICGDVNLNYHQNTAHTLTDRIVVKLSGRVFGMEETEQLDEYAAMFKRIRERFQCVVVAGGGKLARYYINRARALGSDEVTSDEIGIGVSRLNARLLISALGESAYPYTPTTFPELWDAVHSGLVVVAGGLYPGQSTNGTAALMAEKVGATHFINATDVDGVFDADPRVTSDARLLDSISIESLRGMLAGQTSMAGGHDLMDMVALKVIERSSLQTSIIRADPDIIERVIGGRHAGTRITF